MPTNLYGPGDNYDLEYSRVLPALIRKFHLGKLARRGDWPGLLADEARRGPIPSGLKSNLAALAGTCGHPLSPARLENLPAGVDPAAWKDAVEAEAEASIPLWGSGLPRREFLYADDLAKACVFLMENLGRVFEELEREHAENHAAQHLVNIGYGEDLTLAELAHLTAEIIGYDGPIAWDAEKLDGTPQKLLDVSRLRRLGWHPKVSLREGIALAYQDYWR